MTRTMDPAVLDRLTSPRRTSDFASEADRAEAALRRRARFLLPDDRRLIDLLFHERLSQRLIAKAMGLPAWKVCRRVRRVVNALHDPLVVVLLRDGCPLRPEYRQLMLEHLLHFRTIRDLADLHRMSPNTVVQALSYVRGWYRGMMQREW